MFNTEHKIVNREEAVRQVNGLKMSGKKVVFTNGCFDLVHLGHIDYLEKARNLGQALVLGLNTDASVSRIKGPNRPIADEHSRSRLMASLVFVDLVVLFDEPTPLELIQALNPDILTKGDDYSLETIVGADFVLANGGSVQTVPLVAGYSTSRFIEKIIRSN
ncbi:MAG TPA: D-glycero-beta-D-manno-heptose 1-phosphate adenylyltransferase [Catalimonadaceae bacterium]|nr:D-glycero-beta-D-manno-heptose 1-phosphate adenylyltransferase [Catalimonadaceae bacterium]